MRPDIPRDDRGSTTELVIATPLMMFLVLLVVQVAMWMHGNNVASAIAQQTIDAARTVEATGEGGIADELGGSILANRSVTVSTGATTVNVVVEAEVPSILPGFTWPVRHELSAPVERFVPPTPVGAQP
ncbi:TadE/TadG family type IV pilus assembly protein [Actinorugispora endophytica]|uniref:TadE-like protein n=1 Tax=Actinorugispora endophytica TaxID=1605990 RepID=A0A4R6V7M4_9ACTN|nr:TadE/TadG family type IV pilus assembly protein [Actinorugispora endophytica]TDQ55099.1 TadE-like protein [Actinorugispora endophytica]